MIEKVISALREMTHEDLAVQHSFDCFQRHNQWEAECRFKIVKDDGSPTNPHYRGVSDFMNSIFNRAKELGSEYFPSINGTEVVLSKKKLSGEEAKMEKAAYEALPA